MKTYCTFQDAFISSVKKVVTDGEFCDAISDKTSVGSSFGQKKRPFRELIAFQFAVSNPRARTVHMPMRKISEAFNRANLIWTLDGGASVDMISHYNARGRVFAKNEAFYEAAFGARLFYPFQQLHLAESRLRNDPSTRRALAMIYLHEDSLVDKLDTPCAICLHFLIRDKRLVCICNMRSQSALMVLPYDFFLFSMIHEILATRLGIELGKIIYSANSFHIYDDEMEFAKTLLDSPCTEDVATMPVMDSATDRDISALIQSEQRIRMDWEHDSEFQRSDSLPLLNNAYWNQFLAPIQEHAIITKNSKVESAISR